MDRPFEAGDADRADGEVEILEMRQCEPRDDGHAHAGRHHRRDGGKVAHFQRRAHDLRMQRRVNLESYAAVGDQVDEILAGEVGDVYIVQTGERMVATVNEEKILRSEHGGFKIAVVLRRGGDRYVGGPVADQFQATLGKRIAEREIDTRIFVAKAPEDQRQPCGAHGRQGGDRDPAFAARRVVAEVVYHIGEFAEELAGGILEDLALDGQLDVAGGAIEKPCAEHVLDGANAGAECGLGLVAARRGAREALFFRERQKCPQILAGKFHAVSSIN